MTAHALFAGLLAGVVVAIAAVIARVNRHRPELAGLNRFRATMTTIGLVAEVER